MSAIFSNDGATVSYVFPCQTPTSLLVSSHTDSDTLKSTLHRVTLPPKQDRFTGDERMTRARYSIPYFVAPEGATIVECLPECTDEKHAAKYQSIRWNDYMLMRASMSYEEKPLEIGVTG